jgi:hypothetical protein
LAWPWELLVREPIAYQIFGGLGNQAKHGALHYPLDSG